MTILLGNLTNLFGGFTSPGTPSITPPASAEVFKSEVQWLLWIAVLTRIRSANSLSTSFTSGLAYYVQLTSQLSAGSSVENESVVVSESSSNTFAKLIAGNIFRLSFDRISLSSIDLVPEKWPIESLMMWIWFKMESLIKSLLQCKLSRHSSRVLSSPLSVNGN